MKLVITGKGGVGKTTIAAALARIFAQRGSPVVAVDADPNPNLGIALGLGLDETVRLDGVVNHLLRERASHSHEDGEDHADDEDHAEVGADELVAELGVDAPDGVRLIQTGRIERPSDGCLCCGSHRATRRLYEELSGDGRVIVADLEAGVTDLCWTDPKPADGVVVVSTPDQSSIEVAHRALNVTRDLGVGRVVVVVNRLERDDELDWAERFPELSVVVVPEDAAVTEAERRGLSPLDWAPDCPALRAVQSLASQLKNA